MVSRVTLQGRGPPQPCAERGDGGDLRRLGVARWHVGRRDRLGESEQCGDVDRQRAGVVEGDPIVDEVPVGPEVLGDPP